MECMKQNGNKQVDNNKDFKVLIFKSKKVASTTVSAKLASKKLLKMLTKVVLRKDKQDMSVKKI